MHIEIGGKTLTGRQSREWYIGMKSTINGRQCEIIRFNKRLPIYRVLVRWLESGLGVSVGKTQWVGLYEIVPECW